VVCGGLKALLMCDVIKQLLSSGVEKQKRVP